MAALHCVLLPELLEKRRYRSPKIDLLARRWQETCLELCEAAQALLLRELKRLGAAGRKVLIDYWARFLPTLLEPTSLSIFGTRLMMGSQLSTSAQTPPVAVAVAGIGSGSQELIRAWTSGTDSAPQRPFFRFSLRPVTDY